MKKSVILTKCNSVKLSFSDAIQVCSPNNKKLVSDFLMDFVRSFYKQPCMVVNVDNIQVYVSDTKNYYFAEYTNHIVRLCVFSGKKTFYKIS